MKLMFKKNNTTLLINENDFLNKIEEDFDECILVLNEFNVAEKKSEIVKSKSENKKNYSCKEFNYCKHYIKDHYRNIA